MSLDLSSRQFPRAAMLVFALLFTAGIVLLKLADDSESNAVLLLLVVPIGLFAAEFGLAGGVTAAAASLALFAVWNEVNGDGVGPTGYLTRAVVFFGFAITVGLLLGRPSRIFADAPHHRLIDTPPRADAGDQLSPRELEVLELLASGASNAEIAAGFVISEQTVKSHVKHILKKLGVGNRTEAALRYVQLYGRPSSPGRSETPGVPAGAAQYQAVSPQPGPRNERSGKVAGFSPGGRVHVRVDDGRAIEVPMLEGMRNRFEVGARALIYFDDKGILVGWYLPGAGIGVDMRDDR
jgi:DNA-binding CsgD family transcriptional regulator